MNYQVTQLSPFGVKIEAAQAGLPVSVVPISLLRELFIEHQLVLLRGFKAFDQAEQFADYCELWGEISLWPFGKVLDLVQQAQPADHIFDSSYMPLHWDGMFRPQVPEYQIFQCVQAPLAGQGGRTTFTHTAKVLQHATEQERALWQRVTGHYQREMEFYSSHAVSAVIARHPYRAYEVIRYAEPHFAERGELINPPDVRFSGIEEQQLAEFHYSLRQALYDPRHFYAHEWCGDDVVITDNFTLLHGRERFLSHSPRHIRRVQVLSDPPFDNPNLESYR
ncbi:TauD/TfdA dioxygenase family protein [Vibrio proteolyticus]|uniref:Putative dioxygenase n=1 Tax=Vibrio proteolyticus NBRC 13287 TaxID=1219065 RepID=U2ZFQ5_VIBPR|nr:TauD/TfdA family dioxygenase [Vibrio proteolyticus]GAD66521.1 putative dioxygenase [Vibrio proteolyticus NBRC 13287]